MLPLLRCFFAHLLILQYPDHHQNLISSYLYYPGPVHKISSQSVHNFLNNVVHRQTDRQTNATKNITSFAKEVKIFFFKFKSFRSLPAPQSGYATAIMVFFAHLLILEYSDHHQNLLSSSLYYPGPLHKISLQSDFPAAD